jgi:hypothetical protein
MFICEKCTQPVEPGCGYIHTAVREDGRYWHVHHRACAGDLTNDYCIGITEHWGDVLTAHREYASRAKVTA